MREAAALVDDRQVQLGKELELAPHQTGVLSSPDEHHRLRWSEHTPEQASAAAQKESGDHGDDSADDRARRIRPASRSELEKDRETRHAEQCPDDELGSLVDRQMPQGPSISVVQT